MWTGGVRVAVPDREGRVLLVRQWHDGRDIWMLPGGMIEAGEDAEQAAVREVQEETGLAITLEKMLWHVEEVSAARGQRFVNFFLAAPCDGTPALGTDPERADGAQALREVRFMCRKEAEQLETLYPAFLKAELWPLLESAPGGPGAHNPFKRREKT